MDPQIWSGLIGAGGVLAGVGISQWFEERRAKLDQAAKLLELRRTKFEELWMHLNEAIRLSTRFEEDDHRVLDAAVQDGLLHEPSELELRLDLQGPILARRVAVLAEIYFPELAPDTNRYLLCWLSVKSSLVGLYLAKLGDNPDAVASAEHKYAQHRDFLLDARRVLESSLTGRAKVYFAHTQDPVKK